MKKLVILTSLALTVSSYSANADNFDKKAAVTEAKTITKAFAGALVQELQTAMKAGGPMNALEVCNIRAIPITEQISKIKDASVSRVSLNNRNPDNVPNDWQKTVLEDFDARAAKCEDIMKMGYANVVDNNGKKKMRFMKALPTGGVCLACHGETLNKNLQGKITKLYPEDKATGYSLGMVRGAIVVVKDYE